MIRSAWISALALASLAGVAAAAPAPQTAAPQTAAPKAAFPKGGYAALDKLPDWGGVWTLDPVRGVRQEQPALKGKYLSDFQAWDAKIKSGQTVNDGSYCLPTGMPRMMTLGQYPIEFLFTPGRVTINFEAWMQWRDVYTDGRGHPDDWDPTFSGHSIGHWEGDTLVVDTVGVRETAMVSGMKHSEKMHVVERIHLDQKDPDHLLDEMSVDDPDALTKPWATVQRFKRTRGGELLEYVCAENDRNPVDPSGVVGFK